MLDTPSPLENYLRSREKFFNRYHRLCPGTLNEPYDLLDPWEVEHTEIMALRRAVRGVIRLYDRISTVLRDMPETYLQRLGLPEEVRLLAVVPSPISGTALARLDFVRTADGPKLLECNFDSPGLLVETFLVNRLACRENSGTDPNTAARGALRRYLRRAVEIAAAHLEKPSNGFAVRICARSGYSRDTDSARYIATLMGTHRDFSVKCVALEELRADDEGLYDAAGDRIDLLLRLYPLNEFCQWGIPYASTDGNRALDHRAILALLTKKKFVMMNSPFSAVLETKGIQALIWQLYEVGEFFSKRERDVIGNYFLPTAFQLLSTAGHQVAKPMYGRGGSNIVRYSADGSIVERGLTSHNKDEACVYQEYVEPPTMRLMTETGVQTLRAITSAWAIEGRHTGICHRAGHGITDASWWMLPICVSPRSAS